MSQVPAKARPSHATLAAAPHDAYPVKTVSRLTGLSSDLIRAWEKRYGVVAPQRGPRGARLYTRADVVRLRMLGAAVASGRSIGDVATLEPEALEALVHSVDAAAGAAAPTADGIVGRILESVRGFDACTMERLLGESVLVLGSGGFVTQVGAPLLEHIGDLWERGELSVAEEHLASSTVRNLLGGLIRSQTRVGAPKILLATPAGERHELGLSMVALLCLQAGLPIAYAGCDLPADEIVAAAARTGVPVVGLSLVSSGNRSNAIAELGRIEKGLPSEVEVWLGGRDAAAVAAGVSGSRSLVLQDVPVVEAEIARLVRRELGATRRG